MGQKEGGGATQCQAGRDPGPRQARGGAADLPRAQEGVDEDEGLYGLAHAHAVAQNTAAIAGAVRPMIDAVQPLQPRLLQLAEPLCKS